MAYLRAAIISWAEFKAAHPAGRVLSRDTGFNRTYGRDPYAGYDNVDSSPWLFTGTPDARLNDGARQCFYAPRKARPEHRVCQRSSQHVTSGAGAHPT